ncbi:MAG: succinylglutamate desuccinylase/aspartoacylase family protein [Candidatus Falkowbacteria bacterium]|nr:succinylglutamate desuccinylase/aspartoacylase family protein [Candidatus Falkowbacteria bacterium]
MDLNKVIELKGRSAGPSSMIIVGVHGDERCGYEALEKLLPTLKIDNGLVFMAYGNPPAIKNNQRFYEANLNRLFKDNELLNEAEKNSYEYSRAQFLKNYLNQVEALLDVHASFVPASRRFIICEPNAQEITDYLPFDLVVSGFDAIEPGGTDYYMNKINKIGICVECGPLNDPASTEVAAQSIISFLKVRGHISGRDLVIKEQDKIQMTSLYLSKTNSFKLSQPFKDFTELKSGELIGLDGGEEIRTEKDCIILFATSLGKSGEEAFLLGEYKKGPASAR